MSNDGVIKRPPHNQLPFAYPDADEQLWELAGITPQMRADLLRDAYETTKKSLKAMKKERASWKGRFTDEKKSPDYQSRLRAVQEAQNLVGVSKTKEPQVNVQVNVVTPEWAMAGAPPQPDVIEEHQDEKE